MTDQSDTTDLRTENDSLLGIIFQLMKRMGCATIRLPGMGTELEGRATVNRSENFYTVHAQPSELGS